MFFLFLVVRLFGWLLHVCDRDRVVLYIGLAKRLIDAFPIFMVYQI